MPKKLKDMTFRAIGLVDKGANQESDIVLMKRADTKTDKEPTVADETKVAKVEDKVETLTTDLNSAQSKHDKVESDLAKVREALSKELEERTKELEDSKAEVVKLNKQRRRERFIKLAHALPQLPGTQADDFGEMLDEISGALPEKRFQKFYQLLSSWNAVIEKNNVLFQEIGRNGGELGMLSGPEAQLMMLAKEKQAADPKLSYAKAYSQILTEYPKLYKQYQAEQAKGGQ